MGADVLNGAIAFARPGQELTHMQEPHTDGERLLRRMIDEVWGDFPELTNYLGYPEAQETMLHEEWARRSTRAAARRLSEVVAQTPVLPAERLSAQTGNSVLIKMENEQPVRSFKLRGAFNMMAALTYEEQSRGVIAASTGNHALGVAFAAKHFGISAKIIMPETDTPKDRLKATIKWGAGVILHGEDFAEANAFCQQLAHDPAGQRAIVVPPFDHPLVVAGQGTVGLELLRQEPDLDIVVVQGGGWGLAAGIAQWVKAEHSHVKVLVVEPETSNAGGRSLQQHRRVVLPTANDTIALGLNVDQPGGAPFHLARRHVDGAFTVTDNEIRQAMRDMQQDLGVRAEPAGATGYAGVRALAERHNIAGKKIAAICSGANITKKLFEELIA